MGLLYQSYQLRSALSEIVSLVEKVTTLQLSGNQITDAGVTSLCQGLQSPACKVTTLDLRDNEVTGTGVTSLSQALQSPACKVTTLGLRFSRITDTGVTSLCEAVQHDNWKLVALCLTENFISKESKQFLRNLIEEHRSGFKLEI